MGDFWFLQMVVGVRVSAECESDRSDTLEPHGATGRSTKAECAKNPERVLQVWRVQQPAKASPAALDSSAERHGEWVWGAVTEPVVLAAAQLCGRQASTLG